MTTNRYLLPQPFRCYERRHALTAERFNAAAHDHGRPLPEGMSLWATPSHPADASYGYVDTPSGRKLVFDGDVIVVYSQPGLRNRTYDVFKPEDFAARFQSFPAFTEPEHVAS